MTLNTKLLLLLVWFSSQASVVCFSTITDPVPTDFSDKPFIRWTLRSDSPFYASPILEENTVYIGGLDSTFYAVNTENGSVRWTFRTKGEIRSNCCRWNDYLFLNGGDGNLYCLDKQNGTCQWTLQTNGEQKQDFADYFHSTPVIAGDTLYIGSGDGKLYAIHCKNGQLIWSFETTGVVHTTPAVFADKVVFGSFDGYVYALNRANGSLCWKFKTVGHHYFPNGEVQGSPVIFDGLVFIGARDYNVYALDLEKGYCHWNKAFENGWALTMNIQDSTLYIGAADERILLSVNPYNGQANWKKSLEFLTFGKAGFSETMLYQGTTMGKFHAIDLTDGSTRWTFETESYLQNRHRYFKEDDTYRDDIYSIILSNEHFLQVEEQLGGFFSGPAINDSLLVISSTNGLIYCLSR